MDEQTFDINTIDINTLATIVRVNGIGERRGYLQFLPGAILLNSDTPGQLRLLGEMRTLLDAAEHGIHEAAEIEAEEVPQ